MFAFFQQRFKEKKKKKLFSCTNPTLRKGAGVTQGLLRGI